MPREPLDFTCCEWCLDEEVSLQNYYGTVLCAECIKMDVETDWDEIERNKRERIAESNEY
jgi:hypothetical protein